MRDTIFMLQYYVVFYDIGKTAPLVAICAVLQSIAIAGLRPQDDGSSLSLGGPPPPPSPLSSYPFFFSTSQHNLETRKFQEILQHQPN